MSNPNETKAPEATKPSSPSSAEERKPKVGETVWYQEHNDSRPARVAHIDRDGRLNLSVLGQHGLDRAISSVPKDQTPDAPNVGYWRFM